MKITDDQLSNWTKPAFGTERSKATATENLIRDAIRSDSFLASLPIHVYAKGSYKNNTNVRRDSDIDIAVEYQGMIQLDYWPGLGFAHTGLSAYSGPFSKTGPLAYKNAVGQALRKAFPNSVDGSGNRVFKVRESSKFLQADIVPCTTYRYYEPSGYTEGMELILDRPDGKRHFNYPHQHHQNGVNKNTETSKRYKSAVRIMKNIERTLVEAGEMKPVPSYLIECLAFNIPRSVYVEMTSWRELLKVICGYIYGYTSRIEPQYGRWMKANNQKFLFHPWQSWLRTDANIFAQKIYGALVV